MMHRATVGGELGCTILRTEKRGIPPCHSQPGLSFVHSAFTPGERNSPVWCSGTRGMRLGMWHHVQGILSQFPAENHQDGSVNVWSGAQGRGGWWARGCVTAACALPDFGINWSLLGTMIWQI